MAHVGHLAAIAIRAMKEVLWPSKAAEFRHRVALFRTLSARSHIARIFKANAADQARRLAVA